MKITENEIAEELAAIKGWKGDKKKKFSELPYHQKLPFIVEAKKIINVLNKIKSKKNRE